MKQLVMLTKEFKRSQRQETPATALSGGIDERIRKPGAPQLPASALLGPMGRVMQQQTQLLNMTKPPAPSDASSQDSRTNYESQYRHVLSLLL